MNADPAPPLLRVEGVTLQYRTNAELVTATWRVDVEAGRGERVVLLGPSGCGKSTLLKCVGGFIAPVEGAGHPERPPGHPARPGPDRMMVFQEFDQLLPWKTVRGNIEFPLPQARRELAEATVRERAQRLIDKVGLSRFADHYPHHLSGGMKQRVAIARAMAMEPDILLMDEPFTSLDALTRRRMQEELLSLWGDTRFTLLFVTHSIEEAIIVGSRIVMLSPHPGRVRAVLEARTAAGEALGDAAARNLHEEISALLFDQLFEDGSGI